VDVAQPRVRPGTYRRYQWEVRRHLIPALGTIRLERLGVEDVQRMLTELSRRGAADNARATLRNALATSIKWRLLTWNAAELADLPKRTRRERRVLNHAEADRFLRAVRGDRLEALYVMALSMGLRQGELLGLRWSDIDFATRTVTVGWQLQRGELAELKSAAAHRTLPMPAMVARALLAHREDQQQEGVTSMLGLVFMSSVGTPVGPRNLVRDFKKRLRSAELIPAEIRFHDLRHSAITFLIAKGIDPRTVQAIAGHSDIRLTLGTYAHPMAANLRDAAMAMDRMLSPDGMVTGMALAHLSIY
jgi:integrase